MLINDDFSKPAVFNTDAMEWTPSPLPGVERRMLDRIGGEKVTWSTSIVRYEKGSRFSAHVHPKGEEFFVLDGVFEDENGAYPAGSYVRNPGGSKHAPFSSQGCTIFVKLQQIKSEDQTQLAIDTNLADWEQTEIPGRKILELHAFEGERVYLSSLPPNLQMDEHVHPGGEEFLVLSGEVWDAERVYPKGCWARLEPGSKHAPASGPEGAKLWVKTGHLAEKV